MREEEMKKETKKEELLEQNTNEIKESVDVTESKENKQTEEASAKKQSKWKEKLAPIAEKVKKAGSAIATPFKKLAVPFEKAANTKVGKAIIKAIKIPFIGYLLLACILEFILEALSRHSFIETFQFIGHSPMVFLYNAVIIFVTLSLVMFAKRRVFATVFVCLVWIISGFANYIVLSFRTTPFSAIDVLMIRNVMTMIDIYLTKWQMVWSVVGIIALILLLIFLYVKLPKLETKRNPLRASAYVCMCIVLTVTLTKVAVNTQTVSDNFGNLAYAYDDYGFAYCFSNSIIDVGISKPDGYSKDAVDKILKGVEYDKSELVLENAVKDENEETQEPITEDGNATTEVTTESTTMEATTEEATTEEATTEEKEETESEDGEEEQEESKFLLSSEGNEATIENPNVIVIQLESVFDTVYMKDFYASENPMPTFAKLKRKYSSGIFTVPAVGAGTANTEFEVQTGMSTQFFGAGEYPFKTVMRDKTCDTMAYDLKRLGYETAGFHNNDATFYARDEVYANLGFDTFSGMEHMYLLNYTPRGWAKDNVLDDIMIERMKQTEGKDYITTITVQCHGRYPKKHTDTIITDLTCHFEGKYEGDKQKEAAWEYYINQCKELDMVLADFLEQLEKLEEPTVVFMYGDHLPSLNLEEDDLEDITLYETEWVMWDNFGLEKKDQDLYAYQASTYIFNRLGFDGGLMQNFHNKYMFSKDKDYYLDCMEMIQYDTLYGSNYAFDGKTTFPSIDMKLGIRDILVERCEVWGDKVRIYGEGFNEFSFVLIDGKKVHTKWLNYRTLEISLEDFKKGEEVCVTQIGDDGIELCYTNTLYINDAATEATTEETTEEMSEATTEVVEE